MSSLCVAIIGAGPRGLNCLQSLSSALAESRSQVEVHLYGVWDGSGERIVGRGSAFSPEQPDYFRLNAPRHIIDLFYPDRQQGRHCPGPSFSDWLDVEHPEWTGDDFPPRARVGEYLGQMYEVVRNNLPASLTLVEHGPALAVRPEGPGIWEIEDENGSVRVDEVVLALGHSPRCPNALDASIVDPIPLIDRVYPPQHLAEIKPGATVVIRGAALTFIDAALELTEGRGGRFDRDTEGRLKYSASGREAGRILPIARDGRFLDVKPPAGMLARLIGEEAVAKADTSVRQATGPVDLLERVAAVMKTAGADIDLLFTAPKPDGKARDLLAESVAVARGDQDSSQGSIAGATWTTLYDAIIQTLAHREWPDHEWREFLRVDALMERHGFGPPPINGEKVIALIDAGIIDTSWLDSGVSQDEVAEKSDSVDAVIDAVLSPSGFWPGSYPALTPIEEYLGIFAAACGGGERRGIRIAPDASVLTAAGEPVAGLAAVGRISNDWVLGHDTLERRMDPRPERWAQRVAGDLIPPEHRYSAERSRFFGGKA